MCSMFFCSEQTRGNPGTQSHGTNELLEHMSAEPPERISGGYFIAYHREETRMMRKKIYSLFLLFLSIAVLGGCGAGDVTVATKTLTSVAVTPANSAIAKNTSQQFNATGIYADGTTQDLTAYVAWRSSDTARAEVDATGQVIAKNVGSAVIQASLGGISGDSMINITDATLVSITVTPTNPSIAMGTTQQFTATGTYSNNTTQNLTATATWSSSGAGVATISNAAGSNGVATSVAAGTTMITAALGSVSGTAALTVASNAAAMTLAWDAPTTNADGTPLNDLAGYKIYYGVSSGNYSVVIDAGNVSSYDISNLPAGTYYFAITAYDTSYNESTYSNEVIKTQI